MGFITVHPLGISHKTEVVNLDHVEQIKDYGWFTRLHFVGGRHQDVKDKAAELVASAPTR